MQGDLLHVHCKMTAMTLRTGELFLSNTYGMTRHMLRLRSLFSKY